MRKMFWDWKNLAVGTAMGFALALALGAARENALGKYEISASGPEAAWILDTATGMLWRVRTEPDNEATCQWFHYGSPHTKPGIAGKNEFGGDIKYERQGIPW